MEPTRQQRHLREVLVRVEGLLAKQALVQGLAVKSVGPRQELVQDLVTRQQHSALARELRPMHPADIAFVLENVPPEHRQLIWRLVTPERRGATLLELGDAVRDALIADTDADGLVVGASQLDSDEIADLVPSLPVEVVPELMRRLDHNERANVESALEFPPNSVGALMEFDLVAVRDDVNLDVVLRYLRRRGDLPKGMDEVLVVDRAGQLLGALPVAALLTHAGSRLVGELMRTDVVTFHTNDSADDAAEAFERYDLLTAPVLNVHGQPVGALRIEAVLDHIQQTGQRELLNQVGIKEEEDLYGPVWKSARNRGLWLALNLITAFAASRVIGVFTDTITELVALATLMPIVAAVGGNSGNQTLALVIRAYAGKQPADTGWQRLLAKEARVGFVNGTVWGSVMGLITMAFYGDPALGAVMFVAMVVTLSSASLAGVIAPTLLLRRGQDPAYGSSIILTGFTDSLGFFVFLGLATWLLL